MTIDEYRLGMDPEVVDEFPQEDFLAIIDYMIAAFVEHYGIPTEDFEDFLFTHTFWIVAEPYDCISVDAEWVKCNGTYRGWLFKVTIVWAPGDCLVQSALSHELAHALLFHATGESSARHEEEWVWEQFGGVVRQSKTDLGSLCGGENENQ